MTDSPDAEASAVPAGFAVDVGAAQDGVITVTVAGAVDLLTAPRVSEALERAQLDAAAVTLDMRPVEFLGSAGLSALVDAARRADDAGSKLAIVATNHAVVRAVQVTGLDAVLRLFEDPAEAEGYLRG